MTDPKITVVLATARPDFPMLDRPDTFIFEPTLRSLAAQTFRSFEVVLVDLVQRTDEGHRRMDLLLDGIIHDLPALHWMNSYWGSPWYEAGYIAISAPKNEGVVHANGQLVVSIDDCSEFRPDFLARVWKTYRRGVLATALVEHRRGNRTTMVDPRLASMRLRTEFVNLAYGYTAFPLSALLEVNGWDEGYDGAKTLEDADLSRRVAMLGYQYALCPDCVVIEHEHGDVSPDAFPGPGNVARGDRSIKCNAVHDWIVRQREGDDRTRANARKYTPQEWSLFGPPCGLYHGNGRCAASPYPCNWLKPGSTSETWVGADPNWQHIRDWLPVFDLADRWKARRAEERKSTTIPGQRLPRPAAPGKGCCGG